MMDNAISPKPNAITQLAKSYFQRLKWLHSYQHMLSNLVALGLIALIAVLTQVHWLFPSLTPYHHYVMIALGVLAAIQIIRAATKSLLFPSLCTLIAGIGIVISHFNLFTLPMPLAFLQSLLLLGTIGLCISIFHIH